MIYSLYASLLLLFINMSTTSAGSEKENSTSRKLAINIEPTVENKIQNAYQSLQGDRSDLPSFECFNEALKGFYLLKEKNLVQKDILTLIDFSKSSNTKRLWVIDLSTNTVLFHSLVAHGRNTGEEFATSFSNVNSSNKSSLGFYVTGEIYQGKHGLSLRLDGVESGVNDNARTRAIVMHGADYVSESFIRNNQRLGRSLGCPAIPNEITPAVIKTIQEKSCLFIFHPSRVQNLVRLVA